MTDEELIEENRRNRKNNLLGIGISGVLVLSGSLGGAYLGRDEPKECETVKPNFELHTSAKGPHKSKSRTGLYLFNPSTGDTYYAGDGEDDGVEWVLVRKQAAIK